VLNISTSVSHNFANISWIPGTEQTESELYVAFMNNRKPSLLFFVLILVNYTSKFSSISHSCLNSPYNRFRFNKSKFTQKKSSLVIVLAFIIFVIG